ncbi:TonB-dependent receptor [Sphingobium sp. 3R8]|uniref:TonB-dependent receptor n=1 Tax=Sphingobium sp. 3R8 TaxID=2874921 RepID=UPI001CD006AE|nr:TonB-dependent receptor [Sphingobium sp. 3R8]MBZ9650322.1 TonB-dependent receptor [Sphingobium sp. 3R8]
MRLRKHDGAGQRRSKSQNALLACCILTSPAWSCAVYAGEVPQSDGATQHSESGDIVVTARRRAESLERVPAAITAFSADQLIQRSITTQSDLQTSVPGLTMRQTQGQNSLTYSIRGQTVDAFSGSPTAVVPYVNDVQLNNGGAASFFDLASIQVLKGPQGTLFGRNATGGAVLYTTVAPTNILEGYAQVRAGNFGLLAVQGALNIPLVDDRVLLRVAFDITHRNGFIFNDYYDEMIGKTSRQNGRVSLTLKPTERLTNTTVFEYDRTGGTNTGASYLYSLYQCGEGNNGLNLACGAAATYNPTAMDATFGPGAWNQYLAAHPGTFPGGINALAEQQRQRGPWYTYAVSRSDHRGRDWFVTNTTNFELGEDLTLKNILGVSRSDTRDNQIQTADPYGIQLTVNPTSGMSGNRAKISQWSNELQLQGKAFDGALNFIVGAYYQHTKNHISYPQSYFDLLPFVPRSGYTPDFELKNENEAIFAQGTYDLGSITGLNGLRVTAGLRYTWEQVSLEHLPLSPVFGALEQKAKFSDPSWEAGFEYQATPTLLAYVKTRGGFRAGGLNGVAPPIPVTADRGGDLFESEHVKDVEAGLKYGGRAFSRPARLNIAVFNQWINGIQRVQFPVVNGNVIAVTVNVPRAEVRGIEIDGSINPAPWLEIGASGAHTNAKFTRDTTVLFGQVFKFGPYPDTPRWSGSAFATLFASLPQDIAKIRLRGEVYAQTGQYFSSTAGTTTPRTRLPGYALVNARLDLTEIKGTELTAGIFAKNLLNKGYFLGGLPQGSAFGSNAASVGEPRTYGVELRYAF